MMVSLRLNNNGQGTTYWIKHPSTPRHLRRGNLIDDDGEDADDAAW